ncbi:hypothetical protein ACTA71_011227 [Dictyostelium dimigraforme]
MVSKWYKIVYSREQRLKLDEVLVLINFEYGHLHPTMLITMKILNRRLSPKKKLVVFFLSFALVALFYSVFYNGPKETEENLKKTKSTPSQTPTSKPKLNKKYENMDGISELLKVNYIYEGEEFYKPMINYYTQINIDSQIYVFIDAPLSPPSIDRSMYYSEENIKSEVAIMGYQKENIQIVYSVDDVPNHSVLFIILPEIHRANPNEYEKSINYYIGYDNFKSKSYKDLRIFGKVYFFGLSSHFNHFHLGLDRYMTNHRQYRIIKHPLLRDNQVTHLATIASLYPDSKMAMATKNLEELQFPNSYDCSTQRSLISEAQSWGMFSVLHVNTYRLMLSMFSKRMFMLYQGNFQYGKLNHLYLPVSVCDNSIIEKKERREQFGSIIFKNQSKSNYLYASKENSYQGFFDNYVPPDALKTFKDGFQAQSFLLDFMLSPTFALREFIEKTSRETFKRNYQPRCVSMHIPHGGGGGDKYSESPPVYNYKYYADILQTIIKQQINEYEKDYNDMMEAYKKKQDQLRNEQGAAYDESENPKPEKPIAPLSQINEIFILTDDQHAIDDAKDWSKTTDGKYKIRSIDGVERLNSKEFAHSTFNKRSERIDRGMIMHAESVIASRCELFIGTLSSKFLGRTIIELQGTHYEFNGKNIKYVSLDMEYYKDLSVVPVYTELKKKGLIR